jgi:tRNA nucleotidyltransferase (CCA-adding enzyme)
MPEENMPEATLDCYLVGGAVRDELLGIHQSDRDWVVVGATPDKMLELGFTPIGRDFPVFLHPHTKEEYALARTERKSGKGYKGFTIYASEDVTLEQDLRRRDLTINAIAKGRDGGLIDPHNGQDDVRSGILRHVSDSFSEDPVRILRTARFAARFQPQGFKVAKSTLKLMRTMVDNGEVDTLVAERVWQELQTALQTKSPSTFFITLRDCGALKRIFPELDALFGIPQTPRYHPEIDTGLHVMMVIDRARELSDDIDVHYAALTHDLGKALTPKFRLPSHPGHEAAGVALVSAMSQRLRVPNETTRLAEIMSDQHLNMHRLDELRPQTILKMLKKLDAFRKPQRVAKFALACQADAQGRGGDFSDLPYPQTNQIQTYFDAANAVNAGEIAKAQTRPGAIATAIDRARCAAIAALRAAP